MTITGNVHRKIVRENRFSSEFGLTFDSCTGLCDIGFSGQNKTYKISFSSGKIFDNENRYCGSYLPDTQVNVETNFSGRAYDYSINADQIVRSGLKEDFYAERFFVNLTGGTLEASIVIKSEKRKTPPSGGETLNFSQSPAPRAWNCRNCQNPSSPRPVFCWYPPR